jgi:hypothetical protein
MECRGAEVSPNLAKQGTYIAAAVLEECDARRPQDGLIGDARRCRFNPRMLNAREAMETV